MHELISLISILGALLIGAISPGPSFVLVSRIALGSTRNDGLAAAIGMGLGGAFFALLALLGLVSILSQLPWVFLGLKVLGGLYLLYLGISIWRSASIPLNSPTEEMMAGRTTRWRPMRLAFTTQVANPKTAVVYASIFAALLPREPSWLLVLTIPPAVFFVETAWYAAVATVLSSERPQRYYLKCKGALDRIAGVVMSALGLRLIATASHSAID